MRHLLLAAALLAATAIPAWAEPPQRLLTVTGTGEVEAVPDRAELRAGVVAQAATAAAALTQDNDEMHGVFAALEKLGVPQSAIRTSDFSINPDYSTDQREPRHITSYTVTNTVTVTLAGTAKLGPVLDALVGAGANQIYGVNFSIANPAPLLAKARAEAVRDAKAEAQAYAAAAGVTLGPIASMSAGGGSAPRPIMMRAMAKATPISPGTQTVSASVTIAWTLH